MTVLVCVPYFRTPDMVERTVRSILGQTERDLVCAVIGDGDVPPLEGIHDDRLVVYSYPTNRGAYFAQDVAIWASPFEWYAVVASDDWLDPHHIEEHLQLGVDACAGAVWSHGGHCADPAHESCEPRLTRRQYEVGMFRTARLREIGAHNPAERLGQDTLTLRILELVEPYLAKDTPTYHRLWREGSLCTSPDTKKDSPARLATVARNRQVYRRCDAMVSSGRARRDRSFRAERLRLFRQSLVPKPLQQELAERVDGLRSLLGRAAEVAA